MCSNEKVVTYSGEITMTVVEQKCVARDAQWFDNMEKYLYIKYSEEFIMRVTALLGATSGIGIDTITGSSSIGNRIRMKIVSAFDFCRKNLPTYADFTIETMGTLVHNLESDVQAIRELSDLYDAWWKEISSDRVSIVKDSWLIRQPMIDKMKEHTT